MPHIKNTIINDTDNFIQSEIEIGEIKTEDNFNLSDKMIELARIGFIPKGD